ncbi:hypothetical protein Tco_0962063 [Tanacetum coccineum]
MKRLRSISLVRLFHISNDIESNDSDDDDVLSNRNVDTNEALNEFIQHVMEEKEVEKTPPKDPKADDSKPPSFEKDMAADEVVSDNSKPPGFENFINENKAYSWSSSTSRAMGGALGYDAKGCKKSLRQLIMIGVAIFDTTR